MTRHLLPGKWRLWRTGWQRWQPVIVLFVNNPTHLNETYQRFMINRLRELLAYAEVPIRLVVRQRERQGPAASIETDPAL